MKEIVILEWTFKPPDYFEAPIRIVRDEYEIAIKNGKVKAKVKAQFYDSRSDLRKKLQESLHNRFLGAKILNQEPFELSKPTIPRYLPKNSFFI
jgi:hypothetical protein